MGMGIRVGRGVGGGWRLRREDSSCWAMIDAVTGNVEYLYLYQCPTYADFMPKKSKMVIHSLCNTTQYI
jgi:hypothetical protein